MQIQAPTKSKSNKTLPLLLFPTSASLFLFLLPSSSIFHRLPPPLFIQHPPYSYILGVIFKYYSIHFTYFFRIDLAEEYGGSAAQFLVWTAVFCWQMSSLFSHMFSHTCWLQYISSGSLQGFLSPNYIQDKLYWWVMRKNSEHIIFTFHVSATISWE